MNARTLATLLLVAAAGCSVDNSASVRLAAVCFPPTPSDTGLCAYAATCDAVWLSNLAVDTTYVPTGGTLYWPIQVDNQRPSNATPDGATNTATAFITGYKIAYTSSTVSIPEVTLEDTTRTVPSAGTTVVAIPVIPVSVATVLGATAGLIAEVRAEIRATGHYGDGTTFETGPFSVQVEVRNGPGGWSPATCADPLQHVTGYCPQPGQSSIYACK
jgi:hypothetical protein